MRKWNLYHCPKEISPNCDGHAGVDKFDSCLVEALFYADHDAQTGDVDGFGRWVCLVIQDEAETLDSNRDLPVTIPAGTYMVITTDDHGFVGYDVYESAQQAQEAFDGWEARYGAYLDAFEAREYVITSSTGRIGG